MPTLEGHTLARTIILALERMVFVFTEEIDPDEVSESFPFHMKVDICGLDQPAELLLSTTSGFLLEFTANLLGLEEDDEHLGRYAQPALTELANVISEEVFVLLGGWDAGLKLSKPQSCPAPANMTDGNQEETGITGFLSSERGCFRFCLSPATA